jgi:hypothetical protein
MYPCYDGDNELVSFSICYEADGSYGNYSQLVVNPWRKTDENNLPEHNELCLIHLSKTEFGCNNFSLGHYNKNEDCFYLKTLEQDSEKNIVYIDNVVEWLKLSDLH